MTEAIERGPLANAMRVLRGLRRRLRKLNARRKFHGSASHWENNYRSGRTSGPGSYGKLAEFKAEILNGFVAEHDIRTVTELGCGDGNQLSLARYPRYLGIDVSETAVSLCRARHASDPSKRFLHYQPATFVPGDESRAELAMSLDVIFHLVEDEVFDRYMHTLFDLATRFVVIYSSDHDNNPRIHLPHVRHRRFTDWIRENRPDWKLYRKVDNRYPYEGNAREGSHSDFYFFAPAGAE